MDFRAFFDVGSTENQTLVLKRSKSDSTAITIVSSVAGDQRFSESGYFNVDPDDFE
jgi:hypothetical protein